MVTWDLLDQDWDSVTGWNQSGSGISEIDPPGQLHQAPNPSNVIHRIRDIGSLPSTYTAEFRLKIDDFGSSGRWEHDFYDGIHVLQFKIYASSIVLENHAPFAFNTNIGKFYIWRLVIDSVGHHFYVYRNGIYITDLGAGVNWTKADGTLYVSAVNTSMEGHEDYFKIATGLHHFGSSDLASRLTIRQGIESLPAKLIARHSSSLDLNAAFNGQISLNLKAEFIVRNIGTVDLLAEFKIRQWIENLPAEFAARYSTSLDLNATFNGQVSLNLPMKFTVRKPNARDLSAQFKVGQSWRDLKAGFDGQTSVDLSGKFISRHVATARLHGEFMAGQSAVNLYAEFEAGQGSVNLYGKFIVRHAALKDLKAGFDSQASVRLSAEVIIRHSASANLPGKFTVLQWMEDILSRLRIERIYNLKGSAGIAFYWQGADNPPESIVDFIVESPTGFWVAEFYDGPARLRYVFIPWTLFRETGLDGSRPDMTQIDAFTWIVHTNGLRRIDYIHAPIFGNLYAIFEVRQTTSTNLKAGFRIRQSFKNLAAKFEVMVSRVDLIEEQVLAGIQQDVEFTGLDLSTHKFYHLIGDFKNADAVNQVYVYIFFNADETAANYESRYLINGGEQNPATPLLLTVNKDQRGKIDITITIDPDGKLNWGGICNHAQLDQYISSGIHKVVQANLTNIKLTTIRTIGGAPGDGFVAGSVFQLYGYKAS